MYSGTPQNPNQGFTQYATPPPPPPAKKSGPGCWLWVPLGCFGLLAVFGLIAFIGLKSTLQSQGGKSFLSGFSGAMQGGMEVAEAEKNIKVINDAVIQYDKDNGTYPTSLQQLTPKYLPDPTVLHSSADPISSPNHVSYTYIRPTSSTPPTTPYLSIVINYGMTMSNQTVKIKQQIQMPLDGTPIVTQSQTQSVTPSAGSGSGSSN